MATMSDALGSRPLYRRRSQGWKRSSSCSSCIWNLASDEISTSVFYVIVRHSMLYYTIHNYTRLYCTICYSFSVSYMSRCVWPSGDRRRVIYSVFAKSSWPDVRTPHVHGSWDYPATRTMYMVVSRPAARRAAPRRAAIGLWHAYPCPCPRQFV